MSLPLERMTLSEKLQALEELWEDLSRTPEQVPAPEWHRETLEARARQAEQGSSPFGEWSEAKQRLRDRTTK